MLEMHTSCHTKKIAMLFGLVSGLLILATPHLGQKL